MTITLKYRNESKELELNQLKPYQIDNIINYLGYQRVKILNAILSLRRLSVTTMIRLQNRLSVINGILDNIITWQACLN